MLLPYITVAFTYVSVCWDLLIHLETGLNMQTVDITMLIIKPWVLEYCHEYIMEWVSHHKLTSRVIWTVSDSRGPVTTDRRAQAELPAPAQELNFPLDCPVQNWASVCWASKLQQTCNRKLFLTPWDVHGKSQQSLRGVDAMLNWSETLGH